MVVFVSLENEGGKSKMLNDIFYVEFQVFCCHNGLLWNHHVYESLPAGWCMNRPQRY